MLYPTTPSTPISSGRQKSTNDQSSHFIWAKGIPSRFPLKLYKFTPKKHELPEHPMKICTIEVTSPPQTLLPPQEIKIEEKRSENAMVSIETPIKKGKNEGMICKTVGKKQGSQCSEYIPSQTKTKKKKKTIRKQKKKLERKIIKTQRILSL